ncbi:Mitochondrial outer membrane protein porin of 34 kDa [Heracleum sosnowskyi]|uniref:Mitochondrial outer membrane protein porin of 34 kDa n=1 Tax=Heracleum sosnowskyi TaxID=360622 RepID=A0AAD8M4U8_9APIA|nr:Mitochondrial outer membrane protein porin of 34 kDa [Heracleum sosnowskyi]
MGKVPGLYSDISKKTRDLLHKDHSSNTVKFRPDAPPGLAITSSMKNGVYMSTISTQLKERNVTADINFKLGKHPNIFTNIVLDQRHLLPGLKAICNFNAFEPKSQMIGLHYLHDCAGKPGINANIIGLTRTPILNFSGLLGHNTAALGTNVSFDTKTGKFATCSAMISFGYAGLIASFNLNDKGNTLNASYYHKVRGKLSKETNIFQRALATLSITAVGAEATHKFSTTVNTITIGMQFGLGRLTTLKARVKHTGMASVVMQTKWNRKSLITTSAEVDIKALNKTPKLGLAFSTRS